MLSPDKIIHKTTCYVKEQLRSAEAGHDWFHVERVWKNAQNIARHENANTLVVELGTLLHDVADAKFHNGSDDKGLKLTQRWLDLVQLDNPTKDAVMHIVRYVSFKNTFNNTEFELTPELAIVMDADRLDAIGAIGIARTFHYGGFKNRLLYDPEIPPQDYADAKAYHKSDAPTINHFYEKLLKLKDGMHTRTGKQMAEERHAFMEQFLEHFYKEWEGK